MKNKRLAMLLGLIAVSTFATGAYATALPAGTAPTALTNLAALPAGSIVIGPTALTTSTSDPGLTGQFYEEVYRETATGNLDFIYQFVVYSLAADGISQVTLNGYAWDTPTLSTDTASYMTSLTGFSAPSGTNPQAPYTDRSASGSAIHFDWVTPNVFGPGTSDVYVVQTQAKSYTSADIHAQDSGQLSATGWAPAPEPRLVSLLAGLVGLGLFLARRYRVVQS